MFTQGNYRVEPSRWFAVLHYREVPFSRFSPQVCSCPGDDIVIPLMESLRFHSSDGIIMCYRGNQCHLPAPLISSSAGKSEGLIDTLGQSWLRHCHLCALDPLLALTQPKCPGPTPCLSPVPGALRLHPSITLAPPTTLSQLQDCSSLLTVST